MRIKSVFLPVLFFFVFTQCKKSELKYELKLETQKYNIGGSTPTKVVDIEEDKNGIMWFGTSNGLYSYDGEDWSHFTSDEGLYSDDIVSIEYDDQNHELFLTSRTSPREHPIQRFNIDSEAFESFAEDEFIADIIELDMDRNIWFENGQLHSVNLSSLEEKIYDLADEGSELGVFAIDPSGAVYVSILEHHSSGPFPDQFYFTVKGVQTNRDGEWKYLNIPLDSTEFVRHIFITSPNSTICVGTDRNAYFGDGEVWKKSFSSGEDIEVANFGDDGLGGILFSSYELNIDNPLSPGKSKVFRYDGVNAEELDLDWNSDAVYTFYLDSKGSVWIGGGNQALKCQWILDFSKVDE